MMGLEIKVTARTFMTKKKNKRHEVGQKLDVCVQETPRTAVGLRAASVNGKSDC